MIRAHEITDSLGDSMPNYQDFKEAVKFDLGDNEITFDLLEHCSGKFCKPPFPKSLFQFALKQDVYFVLLVDTGHSVKCFGFGIQPNNPARHRIYQEGIYIELENYDFSGDWSPKLIETGKMFTFEGYKENSPEAKAKIWWYETMIRTLTIMEILACSNIVYREHKAPAFLNKKRAAKKKQPIYSYKTIHINPIEQREQSKSVNGGAHASPRLHLRRGHIRKLASGKRVWVQSCMVGSADFGVVDKDYAVGRE